MSYILEALKKSENERSRDKIPGLGADHSRHYSVREERRPPIVKWVLVSIALSSVFLCLGWWLFQGKQSVEIVDQPLVALITPASLPVTTDIIEPVSPKPQTSVQEQIYKKNDKDDAPVVASLSVPLPVESVESDAVPDPVPEDIDILLLEELPEAIRDKIPSLSFAGHVYAIERSQRMIMINMHVVREGAMVEPDLILEEIEENGVILRYGEVTFRINLF
jgi:general secretion pathway protein B